MPVLVPCGSNRSTAARRRRARALDVLSRFLTIEMVGTPRRRAADAKAINLYAVLGVDVKASREDIIDAYARVSSEGSATSADGQLIDIAYETLLDPQRRRRYNTKVWKENLPKRQAPSMLQDLDLDEFSLKTTALQIRYQMNKQKLRFIDLFRQIDADQNGTVTAAEFGTALQELGLHVPPMWIEQLFDNFDHDYSGEIDFNELRRTLLQGGDLGVEEIPEEMHAELGMVPIPEAVEPEPEEVVVPVTRINLKLAMSMARGFGRAGAVRMHALPFSQIRIGAGAAAFDAWELVADVHGNNRASAQLAVVTHPLHFAGGQVMASRDGTTIATCVAKRPLHHALFNDGWSVIAYEAHELGEDGTGEAEAAQLRAVMAYVASHRKLRYCKAALITQGTSASAAFMAMQQHPDEFEYRVKCLSACQPAGMQALQDALVNQYAPKCSVPVLLSHAPARPPTSQGPGVNRPKTPAAIKVQRAMPQDTPRKTIEVYNYPFHGNSRRFEGARYFGDHPKKLISFIDKHTVPPKKSPRVPHPPPPASSAAPKLQGSGSHSSLKSAISAARLAVNVSQASKPKPKAKPP